MTKALTITKKQAIAECKELWEEIVVSGLSKWVFIHTPAGLRWRAKDYGADCPLCEYGLNFIYPCNHCPLVVQYNTSCTHLGYSEDDTTGYSQFLEKVRGL